MNRDQSAPQGPAGFPRAQSGANSQRLLAAILGDYTFESADRFSSTAVSRILAEFGVTEAGARKALSRLTERQLLVRSRVGRGTYYHVSPANLAVRLERRNRYLNFGEQAEPWDGAWTVVVFSVSERERASRAALRTGLGKLGFGPMADAVWVRPDDSRAAVLELAEQLDVRVAVMRSTFEEGGGIDPMQAFDLTDLRRQYEELIEDHAPIADRLHRGLVAPAEAFVLRARLTDRWRSVVIIDPDLPQELLPPDWPRREARRLFLELIDGLAPLALDRLRGLVAESDPDGAGRLTHHLLSPTGPGHPARSRADVPSSGG